MRNKIGQGENMVCII